MRYSYEFKRKCVEMEDANTPKALKPKNKTKKMLCQIEGNIPLRILMHKLMCSGLEGDINLVQGLYFCEKIKYNEDNTTGREKI